jgi:MFS transporter, SP family, arabinose:H+ symporter
MRGMVMTIAILLLWINSFIVSQFYNHVVSCIGDYGTFFIFTCVAIFGVFFSIFYVPETKGKTLYENQNDLETKERPENNFLI